MVHVVIDDSGVAWSSLVRILALPAHALDLTVTAEGVEDVAVRDHLRDAGCHLAQGRLYSPAVPGADLTGLLTRLRDGVRVSGGRSPVLPS